MIAYAVVVGSVIVGFPNFIITGGVTDLANNITGVEYLEQLASLLPLFFMFLLTFLLVFTFVGFFLTTRWTYAFECHRRKVNGLVGAMDSGSTSTIDLTQMNMDIPPMELLPNPRKIWNSLQKLKEFRSKFREIFRTRYWFPGLYFVMFISFAIFFPRPFQWWAIGCLGVALWLGIGFLCSEYPKPSKHPESSEHSKPS
jgi:hypothetical protein